MLRRTHSFVGLHLGVSFVAIFFATIMVSSVAKAQLSFELPPIEYSNTKPTDRVARLKNEAERAADSLQRDEKYGYLVALLSALEIPVSSQSLVFSKTSLQRHLISPANPRAIYFNDDVYVAWIPNGDLIEIASVDPLLGSVFYTIEQHPKRDSGMLTRRTHRCLFCHGSSNTGRVPGLLMQSVFTNADGNRVFPDVSPSPDSLNPNSPNHNTPNPNAKGPIGGRWGGWFVTGTHGDQQHLGNLILDSDADVSQIDREKKSNVVDLSPWFDVAKYLSPHSDIVALLVLQHQVSFHNRLTDANHRALTRLHEAEIHDDNDSAEDRFYMDQIAESVVDGLLMVGEPQWTQPISGSNAFAAEFSSRGPFDFKKRSLRQFDLQQSLFRYPCSYLVYSESFDALPKPLLAMVYRRLLHVFSGQDSRKKYSHISADQRIAILEILRDTKPAAAAAWKSAETK